MSYQKAQNELTADRQAAIAAIDKPGKRRSSGSFCNCLYISGKNTTPKQLEPSHRSRYGESNPIAAGALPARRMEDKHHARLEGRQS